MIPQQKKAQGNRKGTRMVIVIIVIVLIVILSKLIAALSLNLLIILDNFLNANDAFSPVLMWGLMGLLIGAAVGTIVICKKYNLKAIWQLPAFALLIGVLVFLYVSRKPLSNNIHIARFNNINGAAYVEMSASNTLPDYKTYTYKADNLTDGYNRTAWMYVNDGNKPETVNIVFSKGKTDDIEEIELTALNVVNGFIKDRDKWYDYNRAKDYTIYRNKDSITGGTLLDVFNKNQEILIPALKVSKGDTIKFQINSIYRGKRKNVNITALTELTPTINYSKSN